MTAKEKLHRRIDALTEEQAEHLLLASEGAKAGDVIDEWGNLSVLVRASSGSMLRRLDAEDEGAGFSWGDESSS